jgi:hypothetical protein
VTELSPDDRALLGEVLKRVRHFEETLGQHYAQGLWTRMDQLYHSYTGLKRTLRDTTGQVREAIWQDARKEFGHELFIPHAYAIVETVLPALLSNRPRILVLPRNEASEQNVENMKATIDAQQSGINLELAAQPVAKSGLHYGIGVGKSYWLRRETEQKKVVKAAWYLQALGQKWALETCSEPLFDDPTFEHIPVRDFGWDVFAANIDRARHAWHRTWRDTAYVMDRLSDPLGWSHVQLTPEDVETGNGSADRYRKSVQGPFDAQGIPVPASSQMREVDIHEVLEFHDRAQIVTVLDRKWIVSVAPNESWYGRLPFHIYRPTEVLNQFCGKGEIEPIEDLQLEMNQLRTDRRWAALMALNPVLFYNDGLIDPDKIKVGPGELNAVNGDPRDIIWQLEIKDVPQSSVRETAEIAQDIVRASGISDSFAGGDAGSQATATGVQLQLARASARIQLKTHRLEIELFKPLGRHWVAMNQRHIISERQPVRLPMPPEPGQPDRRWAWNRLGPNELMGEFDIDIDGGSTTPENVPQKRQDAQIKTALLASPAAGMLEPRRFLISILEDLGLKNPETYVTTGGQPIPPEVLQVIAQHLSEAGMDPQQAMTLVQESLQEVQQAQDEQAQAANHGQDQGQQDQAGAQQPA